MLYYRRLLIAQKCRWCFKKYAVIKIWQSRNKVLFLNHDNQNYSLLPFLPKHKGNTFLLHKPNFI